MSSVKQEEDEECKSLFVVFTVHVSMSENMNKEKGEEDVWLTLYLMSGLIIMAMRAC